MPKKLTLVGVLAAMVFGAVMVVGDAGKTFAGAGPNQIPVQNFAVTNEICYGSAPSAGTQVCPGASGSTSPVGVAGVPTSQYTNIKLDSGSRLTLPITYTPGAWEFVPGAGTVGNVTALSDILCNGVNDVLSAGGPANPNDPNAATGNENAGKKKTTFRKFGGYALKGAVVAAVGTGLYFGIRALMGNAGEAVVDAVDGAVAAV